jgi:polyhydroxyalkanoate synthesis regulator phasin
MAQSDQLKRYLDAGIAFTQMTRQRAEAIVRDLVKAGEVQSDQAQQTVQELVDRSRENTERLIEMVRKEMRSQAGALGLATADDIKRLEQRIEALGRTGGGSAPAKAAPKKAGTAVKTAAKATAAKKAGKAAAKKA